MHYLLIYDLAPDYLEKRGEFRKEHLDMAWKYADKGELILGGALQEPSDKAYLLFEDDSPASAEAFANHDPYVKNGVVISWTVRPWMTVIGKDSASPIR